MAAINYITGAYTIEFAAAPPVTPIGLRCDYHYWAASATQFQLAKGADQQRWYSNRFLEGTSYCC